MISAKQIAVVKVAAKQLGMDDDLYRRVLYHHGGGVLSARDLTPAGFAGVMSYFTACGFRSESLKRTFGERPGMASPRQVALIRHLWREWTGETGEDEAGLNAWLERFYGVSALRFSTPAIAHKAITALKCMAARREKVG